MHTIITSTVSFVASWRQRVNSACKFLSRQFFRLRILSHKNTKKEKKRGEKSPTPGFLWNFLRAQEQGGQFHVIVFLPSGPLQPGQCARDARGPAFARMALWRPRDCWSTCLFASLPGGFGCRRGTLPQSTAQL